jgi:hypothetical protein
MQNLIDQLREAATAVALIDDGAAAYAALSDAELLDSQAQLGRIRRHYETHAAWAAGEIARRSSQELGFAGLAQRNGFVTPVDLIQSATGGTRAEAVKLVRVGTLLNQTEAAEDVRESDPGSPFTELPWLSVIAGAIRAGTLSVDAAEAIQKGLGDIDPGVPAEKLAAAADFLLIEAATLNVDQLLRRARRLRDQLDAEGIARREKTQHDARSFRIWRQLDGMYRVSALLAPEDGRLVELIVDGATSPRRGGPRFVDPRTQKRADALQNDERSTTQIAADTILALLQIGTEADPNTVFFGRRPTVRVLVAERDIVHNIAGPAFLNSEERVQSSSSAPGVAPEGRAASRSVATGPSLAGQSPADQESLEEQLACQVAPETIPPGATCPGRMPAPRSPGHGEIEGRPDPVSMETVKRLLCSGATGVAFDDDGQCINVGRDQRLFTARQRVGLAARDGGCRWIGCDKPASWCEAHHIDEWIADHGNTDMADGILLCKAHHLMLHNNGWHVTRTGADYWLIPPATLDVTQSPIPMPSKSPLMLELFARGRAAQPPSTQSTTHVG